MPDIEEVLIKLKASASSDRVKRTLDAVHTVCMEQVNRGSKDFSIATIARLGEGYGVPKAQSIRNKTGEPYRVLINAWESAHPDNKNTPAITGSNDWIEKIDDPTIRFLVHDLATTNTKLRSELQLLKSVTTLEIDMRSNADSEVAKPTLPRLIATELDALKGAINPEFIKSQGWSADRRGRVKNEKGKTIYEVGYITALEKILAFDE